MDTGIHGLIQEIVIHVTTHNINLYILIILQCITMYIHCNYCILLHNEYLLYGLYVTVQELIQRSIILYVLHQTY